MCSLCILTLLIGTDIFIKKNSAELVDDYVQLGQSEELEFYQVEEANYHLAVVDSDDLEVISIFLRIDNNYNIFERK